MSAPCVNQMSPLHQTDVLNPVSRNSRDNQHSITFPLSPDDLSSHLSQNPQTDSVSGISFFIFLPRAVDNPGEQACALQSLLQQTSCDQLSFCFAFDVDQSLGHVANFRMEGFIYGRGMIDTVNEIILPNIDRIHYLECLLSPTAYSQFLQNLPESSLLALADLNVTFVRVNGRHTDPTFGVHFRLTFTRGRSGSNATNTFPPLSVVLPLQPVMNIDLGAVRISLDQFITMMHQLRDTLVTGFFCITGSAHQPEQHLNPYHVQHPPPPSQQDPQQIEIQPIQMRSLASLHLRLINTNNFPTFLLPIHLPVLTSLWVEWSDQQHPFEWDAALPSYTHWVSITPLSNTLEQLLLMDLSISPALCTRVHCGSSSSLPLPDYIQLETLLQAVPKLKSLYLPPGIRVPLPILTQIANGDLLPRLDSLSLAILRDPDIVFNMVQSRNRNEIGSSDSAKTRSHITFLNLMVPSPLLDVRRDLLAKMKGLNLKKGHRLQFLKACRVCLDHCSFGG